MSSEPEAHPDVVHGRDARIAEGLGDQPLPLDESAVLRFGFILAQEPEIGKILWFENWRDIRLQILASTNFIDALNRCHATGKYQPVVDILTKPRPPEPQPEAPIPQPLPTKEVVQDWIKSYLDLLDGEIRSIVMGERDFALWEPAADTEHKDFLRNLNMPRDTRNKPDMLLYGLGEWASQPETSDFITRINHIFKSEQEIKHKFLVNTSGSGKTKLMIEALCLRWGLYLTAKVDEAGHGSEDLAHLITNAIPETFGFTETLSDSDPYLQERLFKNKTIARHHFQSLLLARLSIFDRFLKIMESIPNYKDEEAVYRRRWVKFQLAPSLLNGGGGDIFRRLTQELGQRFPPDVVLGSKDKHYHLSHPIEDLIEAIGKKYGSGANTHSAAATSEMKLENSDTHGKPYVYLVLDEIQAAAQAMPHAFRADAKPSSDAANNSLPAFRAHRPVLRELFSNWMAFRVLVVAAGTGVNRDMVEKHLHSATVKYGVDFTATKTGSFMDYGTVQTEQEQYIRRFIPPNLSSDEEKECFEALIIRIVRWLRGRFRFTSGFMSELLAAGYRYPHETLEEYICLLTSPSRPSPDGVVTGGLKTTGIMVTDTPRYATKDPEIRADIRKRLSRRVTFEFDKLKPYPEMLDAVSRIAVDFWLAPETAYKITKNEREFVRWGFARYVPASEPDVSEAQIDEPLVLLALVPWLSEPGFAQSLHFRLKNDIDINAAGRNGLERYFAFGLSGLFADTSTANHNPRRLDEIFTFVDKSGNQTTPDWAKQTATLVSLYKLTSTRHCTTVASTLEYLKHRDPAPMCFPATTMGPDLLFALKLEDGHHLWVALQSKWQERKGTNLLDAGVLKLALATIKPSKFFESQMNNHHAALEELKKLPHPLSEEEAGRYSLLRVVASFPADTGLFWTKGKGGRHQATLIEMDDFHDEDAHPLASLNMRALAEATANMTPENWLQEQLPTKTTASRVSRRSGPSNVTSSRPPPTQGSDAYTAAEGTKGKGKAREAPPLPSTSGTQSQGTSAKRERSRSPDDVDQSRGAANGSPSKSKRRSTARGNNAAASGSGTGPASRKRPHSQNNANDSGSEQGDAHRKPNKLPRTDPIAQAQNVATTQIANQAGSSAQGLRRSTREGLGVPAKRFNEKEKEK
ncbi:hypothetical protein R3P38DRAFT_3259014 [Favolaschia claudopus]|uniref:Uncharacterized protein n=1 Tax=Favolaschia claudopus TaxID=2862362 RepID=A0AAW0D2U3_9AGAR